MSEFKEKNCPLCGFNWDNVKTKQKKSGHCFLFKEFDKDSCSDFIHYKDDKHIDDEKVPYSEDDKGIRTFDITGMKGTMYRNNACRPNDILIDGKKRYIVQNDFSFKRTDKKKRNKNKL